MIDVGLDPKELCAMLITHEHSDHVRGVGVLSRKLNLPVYATEGTWEGMENMVGSIGEERRIIITPGGKAFSQRTEINPFSIPHDANEPVGYRIYLPGHSLAVATDLGYFPHPCGTRCWGRSWCCWKAITTWSCSSEIPIIPTALKSRILGKKGI